MIIKIKELNIKMTVLIEEIISNFSYSSNSDSYKSLEEEYDVQCIKVFVFYQNSNINFQEVIGV